MQEGGIPATRAGALARRVRLVASWQACCRPPSSLVSVPPMSILSIQSSVSFGHVGNSAAVLVLQRLGFEVWPLNTVTLAHHPGHGSWRGRVAEPTELATLVDGLAALGVLGGCRVVLSGYLGDAVLGPVLIEAAERAKRANPAALYCCDPVMGDATKGFYVRPGIPAFFRDVALPRADILAPNCFELGWLTDRAIENTGIALEAARALLQRGPRLVVVKGLRRTERGRARIGALAVTAEAAWRAETPFVEAPAEGAGDCFTALFLGQYLLRGAVAPALEATVSALHAVMVKTAARDGSGPRALALIEAQAAFRAPKRLFKAEQIG